MPAASHHVVIIGGGITGLAAAFALTERASGRVPPITCTLIEADDRLGGKILTDRVGGFVIEGGPESFLSQKPWAMELCRQLGLSERLIGTNPERRHTFVLSRGRLRDLPEGLVMGLPTKLAPFLKSDLLSWAGKCRIAAELLLPQFRERHQMEVGDIHFSAENRYDPETGWTENRYEVTRGGRTQTSLARHRIYTYREIVSMLERAGFEGVRGFGSLDSEPFRLGSSRLILLASKRR